MKGVVVSDSCDKTIVVLVVLYRNHSLYGKRVMHSKKYFVHDEKEVFKVGDTVEFKHSRSYSKKKRFVVV
jgi:small subunit ribosomal protein S17